MLVKLNRCLLSRLSYHKQFIRCYWQSNDVRLSFFKFFKEREHQYAPPSSVIPIGDSSLNFTNAGMNQFKNVFLGLEDSYYKRAYNSQKCIRVGGKHNDLSVVGSDSFHHTFFEMLGNWSFGDYFKEESCKSAWNLLTNVYKISPENLFVTYFGGDDELKLSPDFETKEIWMRMGVPEDHVLPFGCKDNFWEMGHGPGPCGPCTEIHYSHDPEKYNASSVNEGLENLVELWNLVFVQYERRQDGSIHPLSSYFVDTGMGLERITAVLNGKVSNYDTDLFQPLFERLHQLSDRPKYSGRFDADSELDRSYRILADHSRLITISLCDQLLPNDRHSLKNIIRKCLKIGKDKFGFSEKDDWLSQLCDCNALILGDAHPSVRKNITLAKEILRHHEKLLWNIIYNTESTWNELSEVFTKLKNVTEVDYPLVNSVRENYAKFEALRNSGESLMANDGVSFVLSSQISEGNCKIVMDALGVRCDVEEVFSLVNKSEEREEISQYVAPTVTKTSPHLSTVHHLVLAALNAVAGKVYLRTENESADQKSVFINVLAFHELTADLIVQTEEIVRNWIKTGAEISHKVVPLRTAIADENCVVDYRKKYPINVSIVSIAPTILADGRELSSVRICDQSHINNTSELEDFAFEKITPAKNGLTMLCGIYGAQATSLRANHDAIRHAVDEWKAIVIDALERNLRLREKVDGWIKARNKITEQTMSAAFLLKINSEMDHLMQQVDHIVSPPSNIDEVLGEGKKIIGCHEGDGIYQLVNVDFRGNMANLLSFFNGREKFPIVLICKGWGKMGIFAYVPQNSETTTLQKMFEEVQSYYEKGTIEFKPYTKNIGCIQFRGFKRSKLEKIPEILRICKSVIQTNS